MMKRILSFLLIACALLACSSPKEKVNPLIEEFLLEHIANPDTYKAGKTEVIDQGTIDVRKVVNWHNIPVDGKFDVVVLKHEFTSVDNTGTPTDNAFLFYMNPAEDVLYYAHKDKGIVLFPLDK